MKKICVFVSTVCCIINGLAQAPVNYYSNATATGFALKSQLKTIITANHTPLSYTPGLWNLYNANDSINGFKDKYYENDGTILDLYTEQPTNTDSFNFTPITDQCGNYTNEGDCYNREHLIPQSYFDEQSPMKSDAFHVWPSDGKVNGNRGNYAFGIVALPDTTKTSSNGTKIGSSGVTGYIGTVAEPIDAFKGDVARAFFYFATRYEDLMDDFYTENTNVQARAMFDGSTDQVFETNFLEILYKWHLQDPVSNRETDLNNYIFMNQGNRNPYIDHPDYVTAVWFPELLHLKELELVAFRLYPNPATKNTAYIATKEKINLITIHDLDGRLVKNYSNPKFDEEVYTLHNLQKGVYLIQLKSDTKESTQKLIVE